MKVLIIQLSDLHIKDDKTVERSKIDRFIKNVQLVIDKESINKILIVVTGDLTQSCKPSQFLQFEEYLDEFKNTFSKYLSDEYIFIVPGNHDIDFNNTTKPRQLIQSNQMINSDEAKKDYIDKMQNFFDFANRYGCFIDDKEVDTKIVSYGDFKLKINLINSSLFSTFKDPGYDNDKGLHNIDNQKIEKLSRQNCNFVITLTHFSPEWYQESIIHQFDKTISYETDVLLYGHEHNNRVVDYILESKYMTTRICGGPFSPGEESIFNTILIDTSLYEYKTMKFIWNQERKDYYMNDNESRIIKKCMKLNDSFYKELLKDELMISAFDFHEFFVFPELLLEKNQNDEIVNTYANFYKELKNKKICIINGDDASGKTTLCKYIFIELAKNHTPVLFDLKKLNDRRINKLVKNTFNDQYDSDQYSFNDFLKDNIDNKFAIVDDADKIEKSQYELLIDELKKSFGHIIIINGLKSEYDFISLTKKHFSEKDETIKVSISKFYNEERKELIKKVCNVLKPNNANERIEEICDSINKTIVNQIKLFNLNPAFIILFVKTAINNGFESGDKNVFNDVFSSNIINMLKENEKIDVKEVIPLLQRLAYYIHINKEYPLKQLSFIKVINDYNDEGDGFREVINPTLLLNELIKCRVLKYVGNNGGICFINNSFLAYFVAKEWLKKMDPVVLERMIDNICYGINGDILLNICFIYENSQEFILKTILDKADDYYRNIEELDFLKENIKFILKSNSEIKLGLPTDKDKKRAQKSIKDQERELTNNSKINIIDIYDYTDGEIVDASMKITKGLKFIELISKTLPDFIFRMNKDQIIQFVTSIYKFPNKLLYSLLKPIDDDLVKEFSSDFITNNGVVNFPIEKMVYEIQEMSKTIILNIYNMVAKYSATKKTFTALNKVDCNNNINYSMQKAMFYDELGKTEEFGEIIVDIYKSTENKAIRNMIQRMYFKHLVFNRVSYSKKVQSHIAILFPDINKAKKLPNRNNDFIKLIRGGKKK